MMPFSWKMPSFTHPSITPHLNNFEIFPNTLSTRQVDDYNGRKQNTPWIKKRKRFPVEITPALQMTRCVTAWTHADFILENCSTNLSLLSFGYHYNFFIFSNEILRAIIICSNLKKSLILKEFQEFHSKMHNMDLSLFLFLNHDVSMHINPHFYSYFYCIFVSVFEVIPLSILFWIHSLVFFCLFP